MTWSARFALAFIAALLVLLYFLGPILIPFAMSAGLAYLGDPIVDRLQRWRLSRTAAVIVVFAAFTTLGLATLVLLAPLLYEQVLVFVRSIPEYLQWAQDSALPALGLTLPEGMRLDADGLKRMLAEHWSQASGLAKDVLTWISQSGGRLLLFVANLLLVPVVTFYLLRDWDHLVQWIYGMLPRRQQNTVRQLARETDEVLGAFVRGQLLVMLALGLFYTFGLWLAGLDLALLIGMGAGLVSFVPYLGFITGLLAAGIAMLVQTQEWLPLLWVVLVFGAGQLLESAVLTPWLVGDRIGLHPVAVIFAVLAGGQLFGFIGVLLALPAAAVLAVLLRHAKTLWLQSAAYRESG
jgi:predicted PurR-regulated permease PerM